jgi:hypothetical protein
VPIAAARDTLASPKSESAAQGWAEILAGYGGNILTAGRGSLRLMAI